MFGFIKIIVFINTLFFSSSLLAENPNPNLPAPNFVYAGQVPQTSNGQYTDTINFPVPYFTLNNDGSATVSWKVEFTGDYSITYLWYTVGTTDNPPVSPQASYFSALNAQTIRVAPAYVFSDYTTVHPDMLTDILTAFIPAQPAGSVVSYLINAFYADFSNPNNVLYGTQVFANSGTCIGCIPIQDSTGAAIYTYNIVGVPEPVTYVSLGAFLLLAAGLKLQRSRRRKTMKG